MQEPSLAPVRLKIGRAEEHLDTLDAEIGVYLANEPYAAVREYDPQHGERLAGIRVTQPPPAHLALVIGDYLHNLRSALDHLAWQLVIASGNTPTPRTEFPIYKDASVYQQRVGRVVIQPGVTAPIGADVESLQPYHRGDDALNHPLWVLHDLSNIDKHRTLHTAALWVSRGEWFTLRLRPGTEDTVFFFKGLPRESEMDMETQGALSVALAEPARLGQRPVVRLLGESLKLVREGLLPRFETFFG